MTFDKPPTSRSATSRPVTASQTAPHENLDALVRRHLAAPFRRPLPDYARAAFAPLTGLSDPLILDAGCGVGESTARLAKAFPDHTVIGVDKSAHRLAKTGLQAPPANAITLRLDLLDFYGLAVEAGLKLARHYVLYPNPWPKVGHVKRRWHGSPVFPLMLALGGRLELRTNWPVYAEEHAAALALAGHTARVETFTPETPLTPFERKYAASGHTLVRLVCDLDQARSPCL